MKSNTGRTSRQRDDIRIEIIHPLDGLALCSPSELELLADFYIGDKAMALDNDLSAIVLVDGAQISHLFSGGLDCALPPHLLNTSAVIEVAVVAGDGSVLGSQQVVCS